MNPNITGTGMLINIRDGIDFQEQNSDPAVLENQIVDLKLVDVKYDSCQFTEARTPQPKITLDLARKLETWEKGREE